MKANNMAPMSMVNPSTDTLMKEVDSRYALVVLASRRARQLLDGVPMKKLKTHSTKNVSNALEEISEGKISYKLSKENL